jgi:hypothetical protein
MVTKKEVGKILFGREDVNFTNFDPCPSPPNDKGYCGSQGEIYDRTGQVCEAKNPTIHHEQAAEICRKKKGML